ncbi:hypothetical protein EVAR_93891_1 [Eumeta japonica]|uniref:Uncharacterized protein n=1 Tax=Eumeta variegata TaxID=151549 RepID=A0A4C1TY01_EUMVA|nr:hypothetical protein EVAR_93891_1 [Eumeta japonica]
MPKAEARSGFQYLVGSGPSDESFTLLAALAAQQHTGVIFSAMRLHLGPSTPQLVRYSLNSNDLLEAGAGGASPLNRSLAYEHTACDRVPVRGWRAVGATRSTYAVPARAARVKTFIDLRIYTG